jgi:hypothetical protein
MPIESVKDSIKNGFMPRKLGAMSHDRNTQLVPSFFFLLRTLGSCVAMRQTATVLVVICFAFDATLYGQQKAVPSGAVHQHASHGPHHGELLEVGKEEYHVELLVDETKKQVILYLMDKEIKSYVEIDEPFLAVNIRNGGKPLQIKLKPIPQTTDKKGLSSCFGAISRDLVDALHTPKSEPKLALRIQNKSYSVKMVHDHDHAGHNHAAEKKGVQPSKR